MIGGYRVVLTAAGKRDPWLAGFPDELCWKLFGPLVAREIADADHPEDKPLVSPDNPHAVQALDEILARTWIVIHRTPALAPTALLAFHPVRDPHRVIRLNPIVCRWMNTDFDGDQVAFYLPLTPGAQQEAQELLSDREFQVLRLIASGKIVSEIAQELSLSVKTISTYRTRILEKMGLRNNAELMHYAMQHQLVD